MCFIHSRWLAAVLQGEPPAWLRWLAPVERALYRVRRRDLARRGMLLPADSAFTTVDDAGFVALAAGTTRQVCWA